MEPVAPVPCRYFRIYIDFEAGIPPMGICDQGIDIPEQEPDEGRPCHLARLPCDFREPMTESDILAARERFRAAFADRRDRAALEDTR